MLLEILTFALALEAIASERADRTKIAPLGAGLVVVT